MTLDEARKIIDDFHKSIKDLRPQAIVQSSKSLPYTAARIKHAHFIYGEALVQQTKITEGVLQHIMESYGLIDSFFTEDSEEVNAKYKEYLEGLKNGEITDFRMPNPFGECEAVNEFYNYLGECWFMNHHTDLFTENALGAFIYDGIRAKATNEKDIKMLIELVNTSLTRAVHYPGKKSNAESILIK